MMTRRTCLKTLLSGSFAARESFAARRPNLILILADDLGYGDIGCYGSPDVPTPHIDSLARNGVRCTDGYVSAAVCSPSRAALLTGRYQQRFGHEFNSGPVPREAEINFGLPRSEKIFPQYLKASGYATAAFGKWHLGVRPGYHPLERGFDEYYGFLPGGNDYITSATPGAMAVGADGQERRIPLKRQHNLVRGHEPVEDSRYFTDALGAEAAAFIDRHKDQPFFVYLAFNAIHTPLQATKKYVDRFGSIADEKHRMLAAMTASMDEAIGVVLGRVKQHKLMQDTMIVFVSDNGCPEITGAGTNGPLNGEKASYYEGGIRVPLIMQWQGHLPAGKTYGQPVVTRDLLPTFAKAAGISLPGNVEFDGVDLSPYFTGKNNAAPHDALFWRAGKARAVRKGKWKLLEFGDSFTRLFDLSEDIGETRDVAEQHPNVVSELRSAWQSWSAKMAKPAWPPRYRELTISEKTLNWEI